MLSFRNRTAAFSTAFSLLLVIYFFGSSNNVKAVGLSQGLRLQKPYDTKKENYVKLSDTLDGYVAMYKIRSENVVPKVSATVQVSWNKIATVKVMSERWDGPISCSVLYEGDKKSMEKDMQALVDSWPKRAQPIVFHMVLQKAKTEKDMYPINIMRNFSMEHAQTDIVFIIDADFVPSKDAWEKLLTWIYERDGIMALKQKNALVVPAFEYKLQNRDVIPLEELPSTKEKLLQRLDSDDLIKPFHIEYFSKGHKPTDYNKWYKGIAPYEARWEPRYEPYVVVDRNRAPRFWENFVGFGYNKLSFIMELHMDGFKFHVIPDVFLIHRNHPGREERRSDTRMQIEYTERFRSYLKQKYNREYIWDFDCPQQRC